MVADIAVSPDNRARQYVREGPDPRAYPDVLGLDYRAWCLK